MLGAWSGLDLRRRITVVLAAAGMFAAVLGLARLATEPQLELLFAGLEPSAAGEVVSTLEGEGVRFEVRGSAIYVESSRRDALRLTLAGNGLPSNGGQGYELLDSLSGFGTTSQMFDAAYWRAKEGELARTITASRDITAARVHLANPTRDPFARGNVTKASVSVVSRAGQISPAQAMALRHLISAVASGLSPEDVAVIDSTAGLIPLDGPGQSGTAETRAETLRQAVTRLLEARVGPGKAIVEVNVDTVEEREAITERSFDPDSRIAISSDTEETSTRENDARGGAVTVASNLPEGDANGSGQSSESSETRTREVLNYEISETRREVLREPGATRRISVAVLVDGIQSTSTAGEVTWEPRAPEEIESMRDLVASAIGFDAARGDSITIKSLQFQGPGPAPEPLTPSIIERFSLDVMSLVQLAVMAIVSLILGLFVVRPLLGSSHAAPQQLPAPPVAPGPGVPMLESAGNDLSLGDLDLGDAMANLETIEVQGAEDPSDRLRRLIEDRKDESVEVLSQWIKDAPEGLR